MTKIPKFIWNKNPQESLKEESERYSGPPFTQRMIKWVEVFLIPYREEQENKDG